MAHTVKDKSKLLARVRRIKGQAEAVERALEAEIGCSDVLMLVASMRGGHQRPDLRTDGGAHPPSRRRSRP